MIKKVAKEEEESNEEYMLMSALTSTVTHGSDTWIVHSGASKHMPSYKDYLSSRV